MVEDSLRMVFGNPNAETFMYWGFWGGATSNLQSGSIMVNTTWKNPDGTWNLTPSGQRYEWLFGMGEDPTKGGENPNPWHTELMAVVGPDGTINFNGFYGDYEITVNGETFDLLLTKGDTQYFLPVAPGDYNADGVVDAGDYLRWRKTFGSTTDFRADGNGDRVIDHGDYGVWRTFFGRIYSAGGGASANVPEPPGWSAIVSGVLMATIRFNRFSRPQVR
jgi:hypothetical protein